MTSPIMRALMGSGLALPDHTRISESWNLLCIPYYMAKHPESEVAVGYQDGASAMRDLLEFVQMEDIAVNYVVEV